MGDFGRPLAFGFHWVFNGFSLGFQWVFIGFSFGFQSVFNGFSLGGERFFERAAETTHSTKNAPLSAKSFTFVFEAQPSHT